MSQKFSEQFFSENCELNKIITTEQPSTNEIMCNDTVNSPNIAQLYINENKSEETTNNVSASGFSAPVDSDSDGESYEDFWDDFELGKPKQNCGKQNEKMKKKDPKQQMRHKSMVRYKSSHTAEFDEQTKFLLHRLVVARFMNHYFDIAGTGSHSIVINGKSSSLNSMPTRVVVKVYENHENSKALYRKVQNEYHILDKIHRCHINGPKPACAWRNIIVMAVIGEGGTAPSITMAPAQHDFSNYYHIIDSMKKIYQIAKIVHGNLSHRSILWFDWQPHFISWAHSVPADHPKAMNLLIRDCYNVTSIFQNKFKLGLKTTEELFMFVTDLTDIDHKLLQVLEDIKVDTTSKSQDAGINKCVVNYDNILEYCAKLHR